MTLFEKLKKRHNFASLLENQFRRTTANDANDGNDGDGGERIRFMHAEKRLD